MGVPGRSTRLRTPLDQAVFDALTPFGRMGASFPIYFSPPAEQELVSNAELLEDERLGSYFTRAISAWSANPSEEDQRAAASRFIRRYCGAIGTATLIPLAHGIAFDVSIPRVKLLIRNDMTLGVMLDLEGAEVFTSEERPTTWPLKATRLRTLSELRERAFRSMFADNFVPAFERVLRHVRVSEKLMWTNAAESIELMYEYGVGSHDTAGWQPFADDRNAVHFGETIPGIEGPNPMLGLVEWETFENDPLLPLPCQMRRVCCVNYVVPGRNPRYCRTCGLLSHEERHQQWHAYEAANRDALSVPWPPNG